VDREDRVLEVQLRRTLVADGFRRQARCMPLVSGKVYGCVWCEWCADASSFELSTTSAHFLSTSLTRSTGAQFRKFDSLHHKERHTL